MLGLFEKEDSRIFNRIFKTVKSEKRATRQRSFSKAQTTCQLHFLDLELGLENVVDWRFMLAQQYSGLTPKGHHRPCFTSPSDVHPDLTEDVFREALEYARDFTTVMDNGFLAPTARGTSMYHNTIANIRELMAEKGWKSENVANLPYTNSPDGSIKITVATGSVSTGIKGASGPKLKEKGKTPSVVDGQMSLFDPDNYTVEQQEGKLWYLVIYVDRSRQEIRMELSKPVFDKCNQVGDWSSRIIMGPIPLQNVQISLPPDEEVPNISISPIEPSETDMAVGY